MNAELTQWVEQLPAAKAARELAAQAHAAQKYGEAPYLTHLDRVAEIVTEYRTTIGADWEQALAGAFLHDLIEDVPEHEGRLASVVTPDVSAIVYALTKRDGLAMAEYFAGIRATGKLAVAVKLADRIANLEASHASQSQRHLDRYRGERALFAVMHVAGELGPLWERLQRAYHGPG